MDLSLNEFVFGLILASLVGPGCFALISRILNWKNERELKRTIITCRLCGHIFPSEPLGRSVHCSACNALNLQKKNGKLG